MQRDGSLEEGRLGNGRQGETKACIDMSMRTHHSVSSCPIHDVFIETERDEK